MTKSHTTKQFEYQAARQRAIAAKSSGSARAAAIRKAEAAEKNADKSADIDAREQRGGFRLFGGGKR